MSVAIPIPLLQHLPDVNVTLGVGVDENMLVYDHDTARFVLRAPFAGILATGATVGATAQAQAFTLGVVSPFIAPAADSTTAWQVRKADKTTAVVNVDTTNARVGIGTTSPQFLTEFQSATGAQIRIANNQTAGGTSQIVDVLLGFYANTGTVIQDGARIRAVKETDWTTVPNENAALTFQIREAGGVSERVRITSAGNVGIGTTSPGAKLDVNGGIDLAHNSPLRFYQGSNNYRVVLKSDYRFEFYTYGDTGVPNRGWHFIDSNSGVERVTMSAGTGNVGIGTTSPATALHVVSAAITSLKIEASGPSSLLVDNYPKDTFLHGYGGNSNTYPFLASLNNVSQATATYGWGFFNRGSDGNLQIASMDGSTVWVPALTIIRGTASVGIGTTAPATALHVVGAATITAGIRPAADSTTALQLQTVAGTSVLNVDTTNARVGIGTTAPSYLAHIKSAANAVATLLVESPTAYYPAYINLTNVAQTWSLGNGRGVTGGFTVYDLTATKTPFAIDPNASDNLLYLKSSNVGINDAAPAEALDVTGNINATGVYKVDDVQVLSNRVIDARCADVANSGDATTDGLIDALRDAMVAHGLIAAA